MKLFKNRKFYIAIILLLIVANIAFIWSNSLLDKPQSKEQSEKVTETVKPVLEPVVGKGKVTDNLVRKTAHFTEFCLLGIELVALMIICRRVRVQTVINSLFAGISVALVDETIQIFTGRGSMLQDVWLDFAGFVTGSAVVLLTFLLIKFIGQKRLSVAK